MVGKAELCALSEDEAMNESVVNKLRNSSRLVFSSFLQILSKQPESRRTNLSQKRKRTEQTRVQYIYLRYQDTRQG